MLKKNLHNSEGLGVITEGHAECSMSTLVAVYTSSYHCVCDGIFHLILHNWDKISNSGHQP